MCPTVLAALCAMLAVAAPRDAAAQFSECPFEPEAAVVDSLDPAGYYPLGLGNAWEYVRWSGCCLDRVRRRQVIGDTLISGSAYRVVRETRVYFENNYGDPLDASTISRREERRDYVTLHEGALHAWSKDQGVTLRRDLSRPFQSCHVNERTGTRTVVWALASAPYPLQKTSDGGDTFAAGKGLDVDGEQLLYQYGIGYVSGGRGDTVEVMTFGEIDGMSFGEPLVELFGTMLHESGERPATEFSLLNYPNPFASKTYFAFTLAAEGAVSIHVTDLLGRRVATPLDRVRLTAGAHELVWSPNRLASGVYFVQLEHEGRVVSTRSIILAH